MKFNSDIDIDVANRDHILGIIDNTSASIRPHKDDARRHNTGVYVTDIPYDTARNMSSIDYEEAEERGYVKMDFLNVGILNDVKSELDLVELMVEPNWAMLDNVNLVEKLIHIGKHYDTIHRMPEPINSIPRMAMMLAIIRPGKRHLIGLPWKEVAKTVWETGEEGYVFKKAHAVAYAHLVVVNMNLVSRSMASSEQE
jgi:hypothetical protein